MPFNACDKERSHSAMRVGEIPVRVLGRLLARKMFVFVQVCFSAFQSVYHEDSFPKSISAVPALARFVWSKPLSLIGSLEDDGKEHNLATVEGLSNDLVK